MEDGKLAVVAMIMVKGKNWLFVLITAMEDGAVTRRKEGDKEMRGLGSRCQDSRRRVVI